MLWALRKRNQRSVNEKGMKIRLSCLSRLMKKYRLNKNKTRRDRALQRYTIKFKHLSTQEELVYCLH